MLPERILKMSHKKGDSVSVAKLWEFFSISVLILLILFMKYVLNNSANCKAEVQEGEFCSLLLIEKLVHNSEQLLLIITSLLNLSFIVVSLGDPDYITVSVCCFLKPISEHPFILVFSLFGRFPFSFCMPFFSFLLPVPHCYNMAAWVEPK